MALTATFPIRLRAAIAACALALAAGQASATPALVVDVDSGQTLFQRDATEPWFPASLTKLMTTYVALQAVRDGRLTLDTPLTMSARAASMPASKMGFRPGVEVTLDNALKMLMVKSPNDVAVMIAESIDGSVEAFANEMNATGRRLGLKESHFVNPNGLHNPAHVSSARDMAIVARALLKDFPEQSDLYGIGALQLGDEIIENHNGLLGRYPGADGMKTGFTCPAGFNVVGSATQGRRRLIVVVLGSPSARERTIEAAHLLDQAFAQWGGGEGALEDLPASNTLTAPDMRPEICSRRNAAAIAAAEEEDAAPAPNGLGRGILGAFAAPSPTVTAETVAQPVHFDPVPIFIGPKPGWNGPVLAARPANKAPAAGAPATAAAYAGEKPSVIGDGDAQSAPVALQSAVRPLKPEKHAAAAPLIKPHKGAKAVAAVKPSVHAKLVGAANKKVDAPVAAPA
ncbi:MAG: D-alanyl-D-alanine carboxypeptidase family protein, partial [Roseiarcus sp.]